MKKNVSILKYLFAFHHYNIDDKDRFVRCMYLIQDASEKCQRISKHFLNRTFGVKRYHRVLYTILESVVRFNIGQSLGKKKQLQLVSSERTFWLTIKTNRKEKKTKSKIDVNEFDVRLEYEKRNVILLHCVPH